jgi:hypothetical protein
MLYEMVTGERPFPGQNITTVIYKIVNEDPIPPRQLDPSIHPGISAVIMKALCKEPEERFQTCRELLEDLRDYRSNVGLAGSPQSTMALSAEPSPAPTMSLGINGRPANAFNDRDVVTAASSLSSRAASPGQTPLIRRTGSIPPFAQPEKKQSVVSSLLIALLLLGVIALGANKLKPVFLAAKEFHEAGKVQNDTEASAPINPPSAHVTTSTPPAVAQDSGVSPVTKAPADSSTVSAEVPKAVGTPPQKSAASAPEPLKPNLNLSIKAAEYKSRIDTAIAERGLIGLAWVQGVGNTLTISGKLRPVEHGALLKFLRDAPPDLRVIDHIEYDDSAGVAAKETDEGTHPIPVPNRGAIHVITDVLGATATIYGPAGRQLKQCQTPCSFNGLPANGYSLEVKKDGYRTIQTALQVKVGEVLDQKIQLESLSIGLMVVSDPPGADVFINGAKQSGQTPVALPLAPGQYNLVLRLPGYLAYVASVQVKDNAQTQFSAQLHTKDAGKIAWANVATTPPGAEIVVDGTTTSQFAPARVQLPSGLHTITLKMKGFQPVHRTVQVSEGGTVSINEQLKTSR